METRNPTRMTPALAFFTAGDTMEATIAEAFEDLEEKYSGNDASYFILVAAGLEAAEEEMLVAYGEEGWLTDYGTAADERRHARKIQKHLDYMFSEFDPSVKVRVVELDNDTSHIVVQIVFPDDEKAGLFAVEGLADYFAFLYDGYADVITAWEE